MAARALVMIHSMKMRELHIVPLAKQCVVILKELHPLTGNGKYLFPSVRSVARPISENTLNGALRRLGYTKEEICAHAFDDMPYDFSAIDKRASEELRQEKTEVSDTEIESVIQLMEEGPDKKLFDALFRKGKRLESSFQVSDARLCQLIVFYAGDNPALVDAVYRRSSLMTLLRDPYSDKRYVQFYSRKRVSANIIDSCAIRCLKIAA